MSHEDEVVALTVDLPADGLAHGNVGTTVQVYAPEAFEVEFADNDGQTYTLATLRADQLLRL